jgi:ATP-binding cassette subfamily B protein
MDAAPGALARLSTDLRWLARLFGRLVGLLGPDRRRAGALALGSGVVAAGMLAEPVVFGRVVDALAQGRPAAGLVALWAALGLGGALASVLIAFHADRLAHRRRLAAIEAFFAHALTLPLDFHGADHSGRLLRVMLEGADNLFGFWLSLLREHLAALIGILALAPLAFAFDARLAALLFGLALLYGVANVVVILRTARDQAAVQRLHGTVAGRATDVVSNVAIVQSFVRVEAERQAMAELSRTLLGAQIPVLRWWAALTVLQRTASTLTMVAVVALGAALHARGEVSVGEIVSFVAFAGLLIGRLDQVSGFAARLFFQLRPIADFLAVMDERPGPPERADAAALPPGPATVRFEGVGYRYRGGRAGVEDLSFEAAPGQTVALVGPTGSGKTTTLALLHRARDPDAGRISIGGVDIRDARLSDLRSRISVVFQEAGLFARTIRENIAVGRPGATDAEIEAAARRAEAHDFIVAKPQGYDTPVAERGASLSGGERQRLAIARAFLKDAPILILDEATSALDVETEGRVQAALDALRAGRTTFVIAHRLSTVRAADLILVLDAGRIVERGDFATLAAAGGPFSRYAAAGGLARPDRDGDRAAAR